MQNSPQFAGNTVIPTQTIISKYTDPTLSYVPAIDDSQPTKRQSINPITDNL